MLGQLPRTLNVCNKERPIRSDFRSVLKIIAAFNDKDLSDQEKVFVCLSRMYEKLEDIPKTEEAYKEAFKAASDFISCRLSNDNPGPKVVNWEKDEQILFPAINKVAGCEVRDMPYLHWWSFLGYFQAIDRDDLWGSVLTIRQKKAKGKKLEKYEKDFLAANQDLCALEYEEKRKSPEDHLREMYEKLLQEGGQ